mmetsp:Transcript_29157/g.82213  ORF Transcript_29157/g.82213 Transcript_29157/m.82213 type:complete len:332 (+) Transcript_29157:708-1703(+)|eukprot:CAMPEP_0117676464 /NCGR_PEP_ID=MMETSP0804-20121206/16186_1 /TAXON_ID=1074897 /ORGANISM="Tetraselmis astigmatica, Strain CCMP880" /LENGTH=331 /DNA_ID=CAMNT_0005485603 /DNA_START=193 /DNA_END=1188 /DNA_ORIENTATION=-
MCVAALLEALLCLLAVHGVAASKLSSQPCETLPDEVTAPRRLPSWEPSQCIKFVFLNVPATSHAMEVLQGLSGYHTLRSEQYDFAALHAEQLAKPLERSKLVLEIGNGQPAYRLLHQQVMELREAWQAAGCKVALGMLYREPEALTTAWQSRCSRALVKELPAVEELPGFWAWVINCRRENVASTWLHDGAENFCGNHTMQHTPRSVALLLSMLAGYDLRGDADLDLNVWMARVWHFLELRQAGCEVRLMPEPRLTPEELRVEIPTTFCRADYKSLRYALKAVAIAKDPEAPRVPDKHISAMVHYDRMLYQALRGLDTDDGDNRAPHHGAE